MGKKKAVIGVASLLVIGSCIGIVSEEEEQAVESVEEESVVDNESSYDLDKKLAELEEESTEDVEEEESSEDVEEEPEEGAEEAEKQREENEAKEKAEQEAAEQEAAEQEAAEQENAEETFLQIMRDSVGSYVDIQFDKTNKTYTMTPTDQGLIDEISMLSMGVGHEDWGVLVDGMASLSKSGKDLVGEGYTMTLVNPLNHENILLWIVDGEVIYNVIDDL